MNIHEKYISRCIELGKLGIGNTYPNPSVGCCLVVDDKIIGEGYTSIAGGNHAEVNAINSVKDKQDEMADDIVKIKEAVYNPDEGLYARLRELEAWKKSSAKLIWIIITAMVGLSTASFWNMIVTP